MKVGPVVPEEKPCVNGDAEAGTDTGRCDGVACIGLNREEAAGCYTKHCRADTAFSTYKSDEGKREQENLRRHCHKLHE